MSMLRIAGEKAIASFYYAAIGVFGFGTGLLTTNHMAKPLKKYEKKLVAMRKELDEEMVSTFPENQLQKKTATFS